ncbi:hypothetical protein GLOIN_2v1790940 [Rhizophagus clarus]|uniref:Uncharacterized protein n=1 Tax=Rhizophagus clarus TaxID=94130 RepID=A0A8H3KT32_9GLOM|nr:hypothetical protein GLOIN_2v1790940 [Rhizophagus clarus]
MEVQYDYKDDDMISQYEYDDDDIISQYAFDNLYNEEEEEEEGTEGGGEEEEEEETEEGGEEEEEEEEEAEKGGDDHRQIVDEALDKNKMPSYDGDGEFAPYFENFTTASLFCWLQKHNISTSAYEDLVDVLHNFKFNPSHVVKNIRRFRE